MSGVDLAALTAELNTLIGEAFIDNIYHLNALTLLIRLRRESAVSEIVIEAGRRLHLTKYRVQTPEKPSSFCMFLRKRLVHGKTQSISQHRSERVITVNVSTWEGVYRLVLEFFAKGNIILVDPRGKIAGALVQRRMRDRSVVHGESFVPPPPVGFDLWKLSLNELSGVKEAGEMSIIKALAILIGLTSPYSDEVLRDAGIAPQASATHVTDEELKALHGSIRGLMMKVSSQPYTPVVVYDSEGRPVDVTPFPLSVYDGFAKRGFQTFNEALDEFFTTVMYEDLTGLRKQEVSKLIAENERILQQQRVRFEGLRKQVEELRFKGDWIMRNLSPLDALLRTAVSMRREGVTWDDVGKKLQSLKEEGDLNFAWFHALNPSEHLVTVEVDGNRFNLDFLKSPQANAQDYYRRGKEAERKLGGLEEALGKTTERIKELEEERLRRVEAVKPPLKRKGRMWYEKYHFFRSSDGFLVLAGRDAASNEALIKRNTEPHDIVLHADTYGASFVVVKTEGKTVPEKTLNEAAVFAACHSRAWRHGLSTVTVFHVKPEQVSKRVPTGMFLGRGMFTVSGVKSYIRNVPLLLAVGVNVEDGEVSVLAGPVDVVKAQAVEYVVLKPGETKSRELAEKVKSYLVSRLLKKGLLRGAVDIPTEVVQGLIPVGKGDWRAEGGLEGGG